MVTEPVAPDQVSSNGLPGSTSKALLVNWTALATAARAARRMVAKDFILMVLGDECGFVECSKRSGPAKGRLSVFECSWQSVVQI